MRVLVTTWDFFFLIFLSKLLSYQPGSVFFPITKQSNAKKCSDQHTIAFISHAKKVMLKIFQGRPQQYVNQEFSDVQAGFIKGRTQRSNCQHPLDHRKNKGVPEKHLLLLYWLHQSVWLCRSQQTGKFFNRWEYQTTLPASWEICMQVKKQQLELDMNRLVSNQERSTSRLYIVTLLI